MILKIIVLTFIIIGAIINIIALILIQSNPIPLTNDYKDYDKKFNRAIIIGTIGTIIGMIAVVIISIFKYN